MYPAVEFINSAIVAAFNWFVILLSASGYTPFYLGMFFISLLGRFLLLPLFGQAHSDSVRGILKSGKKSGKRGNTKHG